MTSTTAVQNRLPMMMTVDDLMELWRIKRTATYARTQEPGFPQPVALSSGCYRWWRHEVLEWMDAKRLATRSTKPARRPAKKTLTVDPDALPLPIPVAKKTKRADDEVAA